MSDCKFSFVAKTTKMWSLVYGLLDFGFGSLNKGEYQDGDVYKENDITSYMGVLYISKEDNNSDTPPSAKWRLFLNDPQNSNRYYIGEEI